MTQPIEDYALIGDGGTGALVGLDGSIDWLCLPRFDSPSVFGALLGDARHGRWRLAPEGASTAAEREYLADTMVLVTHWRTSTGEVEVRDLMPKGTDGPVVLRRIKGISGTVVMKHELAVRMDYAGALPWVRQIGDDDVRALLAIAGPDAVVLSGPALEPDADAPEDSPQHVALVEVSAGQIVDARLEWFPSHAAPGVTDGTPPAAELQGDPEREITETIAWWRHWASSCVSHGLHHTLVRRSLLTLRALTSDETGGIVAAATTSLPEEPGGVRNWDYRYVWLRDAALTIEALVSHGYEDEARHWRDWLVRAIAGDPAQLQIMYGIAGERRLPEMEITTLPGYEGASPVRLGNGAFTQYQGDVYGEVMLALERSRHAGVAENEVSWALQCALLARLEEVWQRPDQGIWEIRGPERHFTHSRAMIWAAFDRGVRAVEETGLEGPADRWRELRDRVRAEIEEHGIDPATGGFVQHYDTTEVDAALLQLSAIGFVAADDPRMLATVAQIEKTLMPEGLVLRYRTDSGVDGLPGTENPFLTCSFWLVRQYAESGRLDDAWELLKHLTTLANDVGIFSEQYDVAGARQLGNTPQALTHLAFIGAADAVAAAAERNGVEV